MLGSLITNECTSNTAGAADTVPQQGCLNHFITSGPSRKPVAQTNPHQGCPRHKKSLTFLEVQYPFVIRLPPPF